MLACFQETDVAHHPVRTTLSPLDEICEHDPTDAVTVSEVRRSTRLELMQLGVSLADEFSGRVAAGTVIRHVARARERLLRAGVRAGLVIAVESMTRARLEQLRPTDAAGATASWRPPGFLPPTARGWFR